jgi:hypothetical protein
MKQVGAILILSSLVVLGGCQLGNNQNSNSTPYSIANGANTYWSSNRFFANPEYQIAVVLNSDGTGQCTLGSFGQIENGWAAPVNITWSQSGSTLSIGNGQGCDFEGLSGYQQNPPSGAPANTFSGTLQASGTGSGDALTFDLQTGGLP